MEHFVVGCVAGFVGGLVGALVMRLSLQKRQIADMKRELKETKKC